MNFIRHLSRERYQLLILLLLALGLNVNSLWNDYVLDDSIVITENSFVKQGVSGIPDIVTKSYFKGVKPLENLEFSGGRYRPVALILFALQYQLFGDNPFASHLINVLCFMLLIGLLYKFLRNYLFRDQHGSLAFFTCLLFIVHPVHTEVVANVKSLDEIITFTLILLSSIALIRHHEKKNRLLFLPGLFCFFLALLTRESAATFIGVLPLMMYFFFNQPLKKAVLVSVPLFIVFVLYLVLRFAVVGLNHPVIDEIANAPFLYATPSEAFATKVFLLLRYIGLLFFPHPLSIEYGYNEIPYCGLLSARFIISLMILAGLFLYSVFTFSRRSIISFCILYFFCTISLVSNFFVDIGTPLSERLLFQPSLSFCIVLAAVLILVIRKSKTIGYSLLLILLTVFSVKTWMRNAEWKNNVTLVLKDVLSTPNSLRMNMFARNLYLTRTAFVRDEKEKTENLRKASIYGEKMLQIAPYLPDLYNIQGYIYLNMFDCGRAAELWKEDLRLQPNDSLARKEAEKLSFDLYKTGNGMIEHGNIDGAITCYRGAVELKKDNIEAWYNLGGNYFLKGDTVQARTAWETVVKLDPLHPLSQADFKTGE